MKELNIIYDNYRDIMYSIVIVITCVDLLSNGFNLAKWSIWTIVIGYTINIIIHIIANQLKKNANIHK